ncbi:MAG: sugar phosphate isomerase/epimerase [Novosphingobium sp.]|nr:sugar phosphate isomerase/epimerase [Novosphingobium sp.]
MTEDNLASRARPAQPELVFWPVGHSDMSLKEHLEIARAGRFDSLAIAPNRAKTLLNSGMKPADLLELAGEYGVRFTQLDGIATWVTDWRATKGDADLNAWIAGMFDIDMIEAQEIGAALGANAAVAVPFFDEGSIPADEIIEKFGQFCDVSAQYGIEIHIEFIPFWGVRDLPAAWEIVSAANRSNSGIMVDTWHLQKGSPDVARDMALLHEIPGKWLKHIQLADADRAAYADTLAGDVMFRKFPGEGELPVAEILGILHAKGNLHSLGPEVVNNNLATMSTTDVGRRAGETTRRVSHLAGITQPS